jgi:hypothetical protein
VASRPFFCGKRNRDSQRKDARHTPRKYLADFFNCIRLNAGICVWRMFFISQIFLKEETE